MTAEIGQFQASALINAGGQRKTARTANGNIWMVALDNGAIEVWYSSDDGATWQQDGAAIATSAFNSPTIFIDEDDYAHVGYLQSGGAFAYRRGTPNAGRTSYSWTSTHEISTVGNQRYGTIIAHREGTGWKVHGLWNRFFGTGLSEIVYFRINITSGGTITTDENGTRTLFAYSNPTVTRGTMAIDFNHTGNGKTVAGGAPHLWFMYDYPDGNAVMIRKATYSGGTWTFQPARTVHTGYSYNYLVSGYFDGSRAVVGYVLSTSATQPRVAERDEADTTTINRTPPNPAIGSIEGLDVTYDGAGNIHVWITQGTSIKRIKYDRNLDQWDGAWTTVATGTTGSYSDSVDAQFAGSKLDAVWQDFDGVAPYAVNYEQVSLNTPPTAPTIVAPTNGSAQDVNQALLIDWDFNDPDVGDTQSAYTIRRRIGAGSYEYWNGSTWQATEDASTKIATATTQHNLASGWGTP